MKKFTKILALVLALVLVLSLAACQEKESSRKRDKSDDKGETVPVTTAEQEPGTGEADPTDPVASDPEESKPEEDPHTDPGVTGGELVGEWKTALELGKLLDAAAEASGEEDAAAQLEMFKTLFDGIDSLDMILVFGADGKYNVSVDKESAEALAEALKKNIVTLLPTMMGLSEEEFDAYLSESGMTREQFAEAVASEIDTEEMMEGLSGADNNGTYRYEGGKVWLTDEGETEDPDNYWVVELSGDELRVTDIVGGDADEDSEEIKKAMLPLVFHKVG